MHSCVPTMEIKAIICDSIPLRPPPCASPSSLIFFFFANHHIKLFEDKFMNFDSILARACCCMLFPLSALSFLSLYTVLLAHGAVRSLRSPAQSRSRSLCSISLCAPLKSLIARSKKSKKAALYFNFSLNTSQTNSQIKHELGRYVWFLL